MTPYEMLLDDIRCQRYTLKHVPNQVKKDAHSLILEFIRNRPPLKPAKERVLPPTPVKVDCIHDKLMRSIKKEHKLRPTGSLIERPRRQFTSLGNIRESLKETSRGFSGMQIHDNDSNENLSNLGVSNLGVSNPNYSMNRRNSTYEIGQRSSTRNLVCEQLTPSPMGRRTLIKADIDLDLVCYSDDEDNDSMIVTRRKSCIPTTKPVVEKSNDTVNCDRRRSCKYFKLN